MKFDVIAANVAFFCVCGASWSGTLPPSAIPEIGRAFAKSHSGEGHGPCDRKTAANARRRQQRAERAAS